MGAGRRVYSCHENSDVHPATVAVRILSGTFLGIEAPWHSSPRGLAAFAPRSAPGWPRPAEIRYSAVARIFPVTPRSAGPASPSGAECGERRR